MHDPMWEFDAQDRRQEEQEILDDLFLNYEALRATLLAHAAVAWAARRAGRETPTDEDAA